MTKTSLVLKTSLLAVAGSLLATGCVVRERREYAPPPPPVTYRRLRPSCRPRHPRWFWRRVKWWSRPNRRPLTWR